MTRMGALNMQSRGNGHKRDATGSLAYTDPFGLCPEDKPDCPTTAERLNATVRSAANGLLARVRNAAGAIGNALKQALPGLARDVAVDATLAVAVPAVGEVRLGRRVAAVAEGAHRFLSESRHLREIDDARKDFSRIAASADDVANAVASSSGWQNLADGAIAGGRVSVGNGTVQYTIKSVAGTAETVFNAWIPR